MIELFPTKIFKKQIDVDYDKDAVLDYLTKYLEMVKPNTGDLSGNAKGTHDVNKDMHLAPVMKPIVDFANRCIAEYWDQLEYSSDWHPTIYQMWCNTYFNTGYARAHNHSPFPMSGVFYFNKPATGNIYFVDPNEKLLAMQPLNQDRRHVHNYKEVEVTTGDLILFPGFLDHGTLPNETDEPRIILGMDISFKGLSLYQRLQKK